MHTFRKVLTASIATAWCAGILSAHAASVASQAPRGAAVRPNIVVLVADDWGFTDVGAFGGEIETPNIDALAHRGTRFTNFHAAASCAPTRSMLLTGVDNHRNGVGNLREAMPREHLGKSGYLGSLSQNVVTVATLLQDSGYRTYITGKWNVGSESHNLPNRRGFDRSIIQGDTGSDNWVPTQRYLPHPATVEWFEDGKPATMPAIAPCRLARFQKMPSTSAGKKAEPAIEKAHATIERIVAGFCAANMAAMTATTSNSDLEMTSRHWVLACGRIIL